MSKTPQKAGSQEKLLAKNRKAWFNYEVLEQLECGIALTGSEVKSLRDSRVSLGESFAGFEGNELFLQGAHIAEYPQAHMRNHDPVRKRKLLLKRRELDRLQRAVAQQGYTLVPLAITLKHGRIKVEIGLCKGKHVHDKRATIKAREQDREMNRAIRER